MYQRPVQTSTEPGLFYNRAKRGTGSCHRSLLTGAGDGERVTPKSPSTLSSLSRKKYAIALPTPMPDTRTRQTSAQNQRRLSFGDTSSPPPGKTCCSCSLSVPGGLLPKQTRTTPNTAPPKNHSKYFHPDGSCGAPGADSHSINDSC